MMKDNTRSIEDMVLKDRKPLISHLIRLFGFGFKTTPFISGLYLTAFIVLAFLRLFLAYIWGRYVEGIQLITSNFYAVHSILLLLGYFIINFLTGLLNRYVYLFDDIEQLNIVQANRQQEKLYRKMYEKLAKLSPEMFEIPKIKNRINQVFDFADVKTGGLNTSVMLQSYILIAKLISTLSISISLCMFSPWLFLITFIAPLPTLWSRTAGQNMKFKFKKNNMGLLRRVHYFESIIRSPAAKEIKIYGLHDFMFQKWKEAADEYSAKEKELINKQISFLMMHSLMMNVSLVSGSILAIVLMAKGQLSLGAFSSALLLISTLINDMKELLTGMSTLLTKKNDAAQFWDLMELEEQYEKGEKCPPINMIIAKNISYRYPLTKRYVLNNVNLTIKKGEKIAFVGENGTGKTTFIKLLMGLVMPSCGSLLINGKESIGINPTSRYEECSAVMQDAPRYYTFTVRDNIYLGLVSKERDEEKIDSSIHFAGIEGGDKNILLGKETGGTELSGGQWQKIAIARAVYRQKDFIILDEPSCNLDPLAEYTIFKKYLELAMDKTIIYITHRISAAALADRIIVFSNGQIIQDGTHNELILMEGEYSRLYREQESWYNRKRE